MESEVLPRKPYPTDVSDEEWAFVAPYLTLMSPEAPQRVSRCARSSMPCAGLSGVSSPMQCKVHNTLSGTYFPKHARTNDERRRSWQVAMRYRGCQARLGPRALERSLGVSFRA